MSELIDRQAAIVEIAKQEKIVPHYFRGEIPSEAYFNEGLHAAIGIIQSQPTASPWRRSEEGLPKIGDLVLVYDDWYRLSICRLDKTYRWVRRGGGWLDTPYVRYWMPIEPPTGTERSET